MNTQKIIYITRFLLISIMFNIGLNICIAEEVISSELNIIPDKSEYFSDNFSFQINGSDSLKKINTVEISIAFNQNDLLFDSVDFSNGFCEFLIYQIIDQETGKINFACATTMASSTLNIAKINFTKIQSGFTDIKLADSKFYPNDGFGESIIPNTETFNYYLFK